MDHKYTPWIEGAMIVMAFTAATLMVVALLMLLDIDDKASHVDSKELKQGCWCVESCPCCRALEWRTEDVPHEGGVSK